MNAPAPAVVTAAVLDDAAAHAQLQSVWQSPRGFIGWLKRVDHRSIGTRYIVTAFAFFILAGILAVLMRLQLAGPQNRLLGPDLYNQFFTVHGTTMMFLFAVPVMEAMGVYLVPLMLGARAISLATPSAVSGPSMSRQGTMIFWSLGPAHSK